MSLTYKIIGLGDLARAQDLLELNYTEVASTAKDYPLKVNWGQYQKFADMGLLYIGGSYSGNTLVGFVVILKILELWGLGGFSADVSSMYLHPEYRKGFNGYRLIRYAEKIAVAIDCKEIRFSISRRSKSHRGKPRTSLFTNLGYQFKEAVFTKRL